MLRLLACVWGHLLRRTPPNLKKRPLPSTGVTRYALQRVTGITLGVLLRRASQPSNRLSRFLAERSAGFVDGTTPHNHVVFLEPKTYRSNFCRWRRETVAAHSAEMV